MGFIDLLRQSQAEAAARRADPWVIRLERIRGKVGDDGIERVTTQILFDILEVPQRSRAAGACRRLAKLMAELGGQLCGSADLRAVLIWSRSADTHATHVASALMVSICKPLDPPCLHNHQTTIVRSPSGKRRGSRINPAQLAVGCG